MLKTDFLLQDRGLHPHFTLMSEGGAPAQMVESVQTASHHINICAFRVDRWASGISLAVVMRSDRSWGRLVALVETNAIVLATKVSWGVQDGQTGACA